jgi:hypothetical protein
MDDFIVLIRGLGVLLSLAVLGLVAISIIDGLPTAAIEIWLVGVLSLLVLGVLLLAPWRFIVSWRFWWMPFALLILAFLGAFVFLTPSVVWASYHGALGRIEILLGSVAILIYLAQLAAIWYLRGQARQAGHKTSG